MVTVYALLVTLAGYPEQQWKSYSRIEECLEVARAITLHRDSITARCVRVDIQKRD
jgi:hypothetical protein